MLTSIIRNYIGLCTMHNYASKRSRESRSVPLKHSIEAVRFALCTCYSNRAFRYLIVTVVTLE